MYRLTRKTSMKHFKSILFILLLSMLISCGMFCTKSHKPESTITGNMVENVKASGYNIQSHIDNQSRIITLNFPAEANLKSVELTFDLLDGVSMVHPSSEKSAFDLTVADPAIVIKYRNKQLRYKLLVKQDERPPLNVSGEHPHDLVLIYEGGAHRNIKWDKDHFGPYVSLKRQNDEHDWLYDGYLFLEIKDGNGRSYATGYDKLPARKTEWQHLIDTYFREGNAIMALNAQIDEVLKTKGTQDFKKRKVIIAIPEPISSQTDWGIAEGKSLNFSNQTDRYLACKWFIDYAEQVFRAKAPAHLELSGFYWLAEEATNSRGLTMQVAQYLKMRNFQFYWIPYYHSDGYNQWKQLGFDVAYYQPNYFFRDNIPISQIENACREAVTHGLNMELEFDERALQKTGWGYRLEDYIRVFSEFNVWSAKDVAYYQGGDAFYQLLNSLHAKDKALYHKLADIIAERQKRKNNK